MLHVVILAAGEGKRMRSSYPKVLQLIGGRPMLAHLLDSVAALSPEAVHVVVGAGAHQVEAAIDRPGCRFVDQAERLGTGHAAGQALRGIEPEARVMIIPGDMPLIQPETLRHLLASTADLAVLSFTADDPTGYGRVLRDDQDRVVAIREERDASPVERQVDEVNSGVMIARCRDWRGWLERVTNDNTQGEYYLTDCIALAVVASARVEAVVAGSAQELQGANDRAQLAALEASYQSLARRRLLDHGVSLPVPDTVQIRGQVQCGNDVVIDSGVIMQGEVTLGDGVSIGVGCVITDCQLAAGTRVEPYCVLEGVRTLGACRVGPFARLRPGTELAAEVKIGNFVETKNARFASGSKASHLSYVGDATIGERANLGAGTITCNYDGANKHRTVIGRDAFIGSNSALVAPAEVGDRATVGAGTVLTQPAPADQLTVARARQKTVSGWRRPVKKSNE